MLHVLTKTSSQENETVNQCPLQMEDSVTSPFACCLTRQLANPQQMCLVGNHTTENHLHFASACGKWWLLEPT